MIEPTGEDADATEDETLGCGYSYDHTTRLVDEEDGVYTFECTNCGAEWSEDEDGE